MKLKNNIEHELNKAGYRYFLKNIESDGRLKVDDKDFQDNYENNRYLEFYSDQYLQDGDRSYVSTKAMLNDVYWVPKGICLCQCGLKGCGGA